MTDCLTELSKLFRSLKENGYEFIDVYRPTGDHDSDIYETDIEARFEKNDLNVIGYDGGDEHDSHIFVRIEYDSRVDESNSYRNDGGEGEFDLHEAFNFAEHLYDVCDQDVVDVIDRPDVSDMNGGSNKKRRRTRKRRRRQI